MVCSSFKAQSLHFIAQLRSGCRPASFPSKDADCRLITHLKRLLEVGRMSTLDFRIEQLLKESISETLGNQ